MSWLCTAGPAPHRQQTALTHSHFCLTGSQPVPRHTSDPDDPRPPRCRQLPTHAGPRRPARWSVSGSLCNAPAPTRARPGEHTWSSRSLSTLQPWAAGARAAPLSAPRGRRKELELGLSRAGGPQLGTKLGTQVCRARAVPPPVGSRWHQRAQALSRGQVQVYCPPSTSAGPPRGPMRTARQTSARRPEPSPWALTTQQRPLPRAVSTSHEASAELPLIKTKNPVSLATFQGLAGHTWLRGYCTGPSVMNCLLKVPLVGRSSSISHGPGAMKRFPRNSSESSALIGGAGDILIHTRNFGLFLKERGQFGGES